jgi:M-phase phosphoprotein-6
MKRTKERTEIEIDNEERQAMFANEISDAMKHQGSRFIVEPSHVNIESLVFGRMAFHGMNPEIEKMADDDRVRLEEAEAVKQEKDVQDEDMAEYYQSLASTVGRKFATKRGFEVGGQQQKLLTPPAAASASSAAVTTNSNPEDLMQTGQKHVQNMRNQTYSWKKDQNQSQHKKRKFVKPAMDS